MYLFSKELNQQKIVFLRSSGPDLGLTYVMAGVSRQRAYFPIWRLLENHHVSFKHSFLHLTTILYLVISIYLRESNDLWTKLIRVNSLTVISQFMCDVIEAEVMIIWLKVKFFRNKKCMYYMLLISPMTQSFIHSFIFPFH